MRIPDLKMRKQWIAWKRIKGVKRCYSIEGHTNGWNLPKNWGTFKQAQQSKRKHGGEGVGLIRTNKIVTIDLDGCVDKHGKVVKWAQTVIDSLDSYTEFSPSGSGIHIICRIEDKNLPSWRSVKFDIPPTSKTAKKPGCDLNLFCTFSANALDHNKREVRKISKKNLAETFSNLRFKVSTTDSNLQPDQGDNTRPGIEDQVIFQAAQNWMEKYDPAVSGQHGHGTMLRFCEVAFMFGLTEPLTLQVINDYNAKCEPPFEGDEFNHKINEGRKLCFAKNNFAGMHISQKYWQNKDDLNLIMALPASQADEDLPRQIDPRILNPGGLLSDVLNYGLSIAPAKRQPLLCLAAAVSFLGSLSAGRIWDELKNTTKISCIGVAISGTGKDTPISSIEELLDIVPGEDISFYEAASDTALKKALEAGKRIMLCPEIGQLMRVICDPETKSSKRSLFELLLHLFDDRPKLSTWFSTREAIEINKPQFSLFGVTTPDAFEISRNSITEGLLPRFLLFRGEDLPEVCYGQSIDHTIPDLLRRRIRRFRKLKGSIKFDLEAKNLLIAKFHEIDGQNLHQPPHYRPIFNRTIQLSHRLALLHQCCQSEMLDQKKKGDRLPDRIKIESVLWALSVVQQCNQHMIHLIDEKEKKSGGDGYQDKLDRVLSHIQKCSVVSHAELSRSLYRLGRSDHLRGICEHLIQGGAVSGWETEVLNGRKRSTWIYFDPHQLSLKEAKKKVK